MKWWVGVRRDATRPAVLPHAFQWRFAPWRYLRRRMRRQRQAAEAGEQLKDLSTCPHSAGIVREPRVLRSLTRSQILPLSHALSPTHMPLTRQHNSPF
uniref:Uncharacterized protein n=1 Tax=Arundo donax TaxID=35708 RepID=A0A0A9F0Q4_ARUDO